MIRVLILSISIEVLLVGAQLAGESLRPVVNSSLIGSTSCIVKGPVDPSFRALSGRLNFTVRRHTFNEDSLSLAVRSARRENPPRAHLLRLQQVGRV